MIRYKCIVSYCGASYSGWQRQKDAPSVQETIEQAIRIITCEDTCIVGSGRTDAGVNALGQVFHFDSSIDMSCYKWKGALNRFLPNDIHILSMEKVDERFHARFGVKSKRYDYCINLGEYDVFTRDTVYQYCRKLDIEKMKEASKYFIGTHDFTSFCSNSKELMEDQVRTIYDIQFQLEGNILRISYYGNGFMRYMVRMMSGELIEVGRGKFLPHQIEEHLNAKSKTVVRKNAPSEGLTLVHVDYYDVLAINDEYYVRDLCDEKEDHLIYVIAERKIDDIVGKIYLEEMMIIKIVVLKSDVDKTEMFLKDVKEKLINKYSNVKEIVVGKYE